MSERIPSDVDKIDMVLRKYDLQGFVERSRGDTYTQEAQMFLDRIASSGPLTAQYVRDVWLVMFESEDTLRSMAGGGLGRHFQPRRFVWVGDMPMRPEFQQIADEINALFVRRAVEGRL